MSEGEAALALCLRRLEQRSELTDQDRATVLSWPGIVTHYKSSRDVVRLGEQTRHSCLVMDGMVARFGQTSDGHRQLTALYIPGDMADLHSTVLPLVSSPLQSLISATLYRIPHDVIREAAASSPTLGQALWRDCTVDAQIASEWLLNIGRRGAVEKLAHLICELACRYRAAGLGEHRFPLLLTQVHVGEALGLTGVHVNRMLRVLRDRELIAMDDGDLVIRDWDGLRAVGDFDPMYLHLFREEQT